MPRDQRLAHSREMAYKVVMVTQEYLAWKVGLAEVSFMTGLNPFIKEVQAAIYADDCFLLPDK